MKYIYRWITALLIIGGMLLVACASRSTPQVKIQPSILETVEGSKFKRVVLTQKAAERIDIQTAQIQDLMVERTQAFGSEVVTFPRADGSASDTVWVRVSLGDNDLPRVDRSQSARVLSLDDEEDSDDVDGLTAEVDEGIKGDDAEESAQVLYYKIGSTEHNLLPGQRVFVELPLVGSGDQRKVIPYAAVIYGLEGEAWVYTNPEPLVFVREPIVIDYIDEDQVILSEGPEAGAAIVTVGAAELFGAETGVSK